MLKYNAKFESNAFLKQTHYTHLVLSSKWYKAKKKNKFVSSRPRAFRFALKICAFHFFSYIEKKNP